jgi:LPPG:FO 2-phospho-L-lactate transferase
LILALAGGVGGAKMAAGLAARLRPEELLVVVNTGDDFTHLGLHISPDLDTVMYWLASMNDADRGWGRAGETWNFMAALEGLGQPTWFNLGDRDLATHVVRTAQLKGGTPLSEVTSFLCRRFGIAHRIVPMSDDSVRTFVRTDQGALEFQDYFVRRRCEPRLVGLEFRSAESAHVSAAFAAALADEGLEAVIICPSNPFLSIDPILAIAGVRDQLAHHRAPIVAVSPIVGGRAIKGPLAKILNEKSFESSAVTIATLYADLIDGIVIDDTDIGLTRQIEALGVPVCVTNIVMTDSADRLRLADSVIRFAGSLRVRSHA